jgi:hypothetical protein
MGISYGSDLVFGVHYSIEEIYNCFQKFFSENEDWDIDDLNNVLLNEFFVDGVKFYAELNPFDNHQPIEYYLGIPLTIQMLKENPNYKKFTCIIKEEINAIIRNRYDLEYIEPDIYDLPYYYY